MTDHSRLICSQTGFENIILCLEATMCGCTSTLSREGLALLGYAPGEVADMHIFDFFSERDRHFIKRIMVELRASRYRNWGRHEMRAKHGESVPVTLASLCDEFRGYLIAVHTAELPYETHLMRYSDPREIEKIQEHYGVVDYTKLKEEELHFHFGLYDDSQEPHEVAAERLAREFIDKLKPLEGRTVLDIGCGTGRCAIKLALEYGCQVDAVTVSRQQYEIAVTKALNHGVEEKVRFNHADANTMELQETKYDIIYAIESICHMNRENIFRKAYRALKTGGLFSFCDLYPAKGGILYLRSGALTFISIHQNIRGLRQQGFKAIQVSDWSDRIIPTFRRVDGQYDKVAAWAIDQGLSAELACQSVEAQSGSKLSEFTKDRITRAIIARRSGKTLVDLAIRDFGYCDFVAMK